MPVNRRYNLSALLRCMEQEFPATTATRPAHLPSDSPLRQKGLRAPSPPHKDNGEGTVQGDCVEVDCRAAPASSQAESQRISSEQSTLAAVSPELHSAVTGADHTMLNGSVPVDDQRRGSVGGGICEEQEERERRVTSEEDQANTVRRNRKGRHVFIEYVMLDGINDR